MQCGQGPGIGVCTLLPFQDQGCHENLKSRVKHSLVVLLNLSSYRKVLEPTKWLVAEYSRFLSAITNVYTVTEGIQKPKW